MRTQNASVTAVEDFSMLVMNGAMMFERMEAKRRSMASQINVLEIS